MNREEVKRLSHEAGMFGGVPEMEGATISERMERFASLVAAAERKECLAVVKEALKGEHPGNGKVYGALKWVWRHIQDRAL